MSFKDSLNWINIKGRHLQSGIAFILHRLTGLVILLYLYIHLAALSQLLNGGLAYKNFLATVESPPFIVLDILLFLVIFYHGANGIRLVVQEFGIGTRKRKIFFWIMMVLGLIGWILLTYFVVSSFIGGA
ncbi:MAG: succinate dehydrogenase, cytochrome b556 subunit [Thermoplasmata archaeon]